MSSVVQFWDLLQGARGSQLRVFAHAFAVSALLDKPSFRAMKEFGLVEIVRHIEKKNTHMLR